jgi:hypothetical protein
MYTQICILYTGSASCTRVHANKILILRLRGGPCVVYERVVERKNRETKMIRVPRRKIKIFIISVIIKISKIERFSVEYSLWVEHTQYNK